MTGSRTVARRVLACVMALAAAGSVHAAELDLDGFWQTTIDCGGFGTVVQVTDIAHDPSGSSYTHTSPAGCGGFSFSFGGDPIELASCVSVPDPIPGSITGTSIVSPPSGLYGVTSVVNWPFDYNGCLVEQIVSQHRITGTVRNEMGGVATEIDGTFAIGAYAFLDGGGGICIGGLDVANCSLVMRRNGVPVGTDVVASPHELITLTFPSVTTAGYATAIPTENGAAPLPAGMRPVGVPYLDLVSTAISSGDTQVCVRYRDANDDGWLDALAPAVDESGLVLLAEVAGAFVDVTTVRDAAGNVVCGDVAVLDQVVLAAPAAPPARRCTPLSSPLFHPVTITISPDDAHVYVGTQKTVGDDALMAFAADPGTGDLSFVQAAVDDALMTESLELIEDVVVSQDGAHLYATSCRDDALTAFARDPSSGSFVPLATYRGGLGGVGAFDCPNHIALSPDGTSLYVTTIGSDALVVFDRDPASGALSHVQTAGELIDGAAGVRVSPDGLFVYVTGTLASQVFVYARDPLTGTVTLASTAPTPGDGRLLLSSDGARLYAMGSRLEVFERDLVSGALTLLDSLNLPSTGPADIVLSPDESHLYLLTNTEVATYARDAGTGLLTPVGTLAQVGRELVFASDGTRGYLTDRNAHAIVRLARDPGTGVLSVVATTTRQVLTDLDGTAARAVTADGTSLYMVADRHDALAHFCREPWGEIAWARSWFDGDPGVTGLAGAEAVRVSPDGAHLYAVGRDADALTVWARDLLTGDLTPVETHSDGVAGVDGLDGPRDLAVSGDGAHVYVAGLHDDAVAVFARDAGTGALTFVETVRDREGDVIGLQTAYALALSPDGAHLYATGLFANAVVVFARDAGTGRLAFVERVRDKDGGVSGMRGPAGILVSPDGAHVYVAGYHAGAVAAFARDAGTGRLTFLETQQNPIGPLLRDHLRNVHDLLMPPDGRFLYAGTRTTFGTRVTNEGRGGVIFARDPASGLLAYVSTYGPSSIAAFGQGAALAPGGSHLYAGDGGLATYDRQAQSGSIVLANEHPATSSPLPVTIEPHCLAPVKSGASLLVISNEADDERDKLKWKWSKGPAIPTPEMAFGTLRIFDASGNPQPVYDERLAPLGFLRGNAFRVAREVVYKVNAREWDGLNRAVLKAGPLRKGKATVKGRRGLLNLADLPFTLPLRVQFIAGAVCLEATFSAAKENSPERFVARSD